MTAWPCLEKAEAYLALHLTHAGPASPAVGTGPFVTVSREAGTGGAEFADALARELSAADEDQPWTVYSANLIEEMLRTHDLPARLARFLPEDRVSELDAAVGEIVGLHPNLWDLVAKTDELMRRLARTGHAILLGRGANFATADLGRGVHVRLVARAAYRAQLTQRRQGVSREEAYAINSLSDAARRRYVQSHFDADVADPASYSLLLNIEHLSREAMIELVLALVRPHLRQEAAQDKYR